MPHTSAFGKLPIALIFPGESAWENRDVPINPSNRSTRLTSTQKDGNVVLSFAGKTACVPFENASDAQDECLGTDALRQLGLIAQDGALIVASEFEVFLNAASNTVPPLSSYLNDGNIAMLAVRLQRQFLKEMRRYDAPTFGEMTLAVHSVLSKSIAPERAGQISIYEWQSGATRRWKGIINAGGTSPLAPDDAAIRCGVVITLSGAFPFGAVPDLEPAILVRMTPVSHSHSLMLVDLVTLFAPVIQTHLRHLSDELQHREFSKGVRTCLTIPRGSDDILAYELIHPLKYALGNYRSVAFWRFSRTVGSYEKLAEHTVPKNPRFQEESISNWKRHTTSACHLQPLPPICILCHDSDRHALNGIMQRFFHIPSVAPDFVEKLLTDAEFPLLFENYVMLTMPSVESLDGLVAGTEWGIRNIIELLLRMRPAPGELLCILNYNHGLQRFQFLHGLALHWSKAGAPKPCSFQAAG